MRGMKEREGGGERERRWRDTLQRNGLPRDHSVLQCMEIMMK